MKERPILSSGPEVRALLDGTKTQTRRVVRFRQEPAQTARFERLNGHSQAIFTDGTWVPCPYGQPGDRLWVRERWAPELGHFHHTIAYAESGTLGSENGVFPNDDQQVWIERYERKHDCRFDYTGLWREKGTALKWGPSIHMPHWASRITLEITAVRVERLQDISEEDAKAEGIIEWSDPPRVETKHYGLTVADVWETTAKAAYRRLWESINGPGSWDANPWAWVVDFKRVGQ